MNINGYTVIIISGKRVYISIESNISKVIDVSSERAKYDENVKQILSDKQILARILKYTLEDFKDSNIETIVKNIDEPEVSKVRIEPGLTNTQKIRKESEEDNVPGEGKIFFDIRFSAYVGREPIKILINIEAQKSSDKGRLGYQLDNRVIYYLGRMISAQKEVEFARSDYDNLKPVRSIWICMDASDDEDSINRLVLRQETIFGKNMELFNLDKLQGVIIRLRSNEKVEKSRNTLIAMLEELLGKENEIEKKKRLSEEFGLVMSIETERRLGEMCNLSEVLVEKGIEKGQTDLVEVIKRLRNGESSADIIESGVDERTVNLALTIK
ncbi:hypothetical protein [Butyrivibrio sp. AE2015]|uniref:hypothetical protein n=1 Tax=Butyrivibrio sp. AE2015 TaxID=1280663 RepID=UPI0003B5E082|nr:hypothetical protein [Butyrivibrio sp. AE2015]